MMTVRQEEGRPIRITPRFNHIVRLEGIILEISTLQGRSGRQLLRLTMEWDSRCYQVYVPRDKADHLMVGQLIRVAGTSRINGSVIEVACEVLEYLDVDSMPSAVALLPLSRCPQGAQKSIPILNELEHSLPNGLRRFMIRVLLDPRITLPLLTCKASTAHHHAAEGGLLMHSTQMLPTIRPLCAALLPQEPEAWAYASLGFLFHDIGKLMTVGSGAYRPARRGLRHESEGLWLLAPHLEWLDGFDPTSSAVLRYIFDFVATPAADRRQAKYLVADIVVMLDRLSAGADNRRGKADLLRRALGMGAANDATYSLKHHHQQWEVYRG